MSALLATQYAQTLAMLRTRLLCPVPACSISALVGTRYCSKRTRLQRRLNNQFLVVVAVLDDGWIERAAALEAERCVVVADRVVIAREAGAVLRDDGEIAGGIPPSASDNAMSLARLESTSSGAVSFEAEKRPAAPRGELFSATQSSGSSALRAVLCASIISHPC
ncbi:hypothetical protein [Stutzerimonas stutzeri]|uniref:hypothetical protein n=1 Tax=Stutzerimonas stutzeri TaxID=316 RepID=UPI00210A75E6|nr:hypothetical protein [Stutzerimonas stutzeri]MCQ4257563.1 hypothetical protein [Stutzerimonas stutzeri]